MADIGDRAKGEPKVVQKCLDPSCSGIITWVGGGTLCCSQCGKISSPQVLLASRPVEKRTQKL